MPKTILNTRGHDLEAAGVLFKPGENALTDAQVAKMTGNGQIAVWAGKGWLREKSEGAPQFVADLEAAALVAKAEQAAKLEADRKARDAEAAQRAEKAKADARGASVETKPAAPASQPDADKPSAAPAVASAAPAKVDAAPKGKPGKG